MRRTSITPPTPAPDPAAPPPGAPAEKGPAPGPPPLGNALLVLFGIIMVIFGALSFIEVRGGGAGPVFYSTVGLCVLVVVLAACYKAGLLARPGPPSPARRARGGRRTTRTGAGGGAQGRSSSS